MEEHFGVVILAAGASSRMGRAKLLLPWGGTTVLGRLIAQWREVGAAQIAVLCANGDSNLNAELERLGISVQHRIVNSDPTQGMFSSIQCAARWQNWSSALTHVAIALGDQPHIANATLRAVAQFTSLHTESIGQPGRGGRPRHPVFISKAAFKALAGTNCATLKEFLAQRIAQVQLIESDDAGLDFDMDTPADYERAQRHFFGTGQGRMVG